MLQKTVKLLALTVTLIISGCASTHTMSLKRGEGFDMEIKGAGPLKETVVLVAQNCEAYKNESDLLRFSTTFRNVHTETLTVRAKVLFCDSKHPKDQSGDNWTTLVIEPYQSHYFYQTAKKKNFDLFTLETKVTNKKNL